MGKSIAGTPDTVEIAKAQARRLRNALQGKISLSNCQALEVMAATHGRQNWAALQAELSRRAASEAKPQTDVSSIAGMVTGRIRQSRRSRVFVVQGERGSGKSKLASQCCDALTDKAIRLTSFTAAACHALEWKKLDLIIFDEIDLRKEGEVVFFNKNMPSVFEQANRHGVSVILSGRKITPILDCVPVGAEVINL